MQIDADFYEGAIFLEQEKYYTAIDYSNSLNLQDYTLTFIHGAV